jgi:hypothetical protein
MMIAPWLPGILFAAVWFVLLFVVGQRALWIAAAVAVGVLAAWLGLVRLLRGHGDGP